MAENFTTVGQLKHWLERFEDDDPILAQEGQVSNPALRIHGIKEMFLSNTTYPIVNSDKCLQDLSNITNPTRVAVILI